MHEYSIVQALMDQVEATVEQHSATSVRRVHLAIGEMSGVEIPLLETAYDTFRPGTICADAELLVERVAARWACPGCGGPPDPATPMRCSTCDRPVHLAEGGDILLSRLELEVDDV